MRLNDVVRIGFQNSVLMEGSVNEDSRDILLQLKRGQDAIKEYFCKGEFYIVAEHIDKIWLSLYGLFLKRGIEKAIRKESSAEDLTKLSLNIDSVWRFCVKLLSFLDDLFHANNVLYEDGLIPISSLFVCFADMLLYRQLYLGNDEFLTDENLMSIPLFQYYVKNFTSVKNFYKKCIAWNLHSERAWKGLFFLYDKNGKDFDALRSALRTLINEKEKSSFLRKFLVRISAMHQKYSEGTDKSLCPIIIKMLNKLSLSHLPVCLSLQDAIEITREFKLAVKDLLDFQQYPNLDDAQIKKKIYNNFSLGFDSLICSALLVENKRLEFNESVSGGENVTRTRVNFATPIDPAYLSRANETGKTLWYLVLYFIQRACMFSINSLQQLIRAKGKNQRHSSRNSASLTNTSTHPPVSPTPSQSDLDRCQAKASLSLQLLEHTLLWLRNQDPSLISSSIPLMSNVRSWIIKVGKMIYAIVRKKKITSKIYSLQDDHHLKLLTSNVISFPVMEQKNLNAICALHNKLKKENKKIVCRHQKKVVEEMEHSDDEDYRRLPLSVIKGEGESKSGRNSSVVSAVSPMVLNGSGVLNTSGSGIDNGMNMGTAMPKYGSVQFRCAPLECFVPEPAFYVEEDVFMPSPPPGFELNERDWDSIVYDNAMEDKQDTSFPSGGGFMPPEELDEDDQLLYQCYNYHMLEGEGEEREGEGKGEIGEIETGDDDTGDEIQGKKEEEEEEEEEEEQAEEEQGLLNVSAHSQATGKLCHLCSKNYFASTKLLFKKIRKMIPFVRFSPFGEAKVFPWPPTIFFSLEYKNKAFNLDKNLSKNAYFLSRLLRVFSLVSDFPQVGRRRSGGAAGVGGKNAQLFGEMTTGRGSYSHGGKKHRGANRASMKKFS